jgi:hypothetical protein
MLYSKKIIASRTEAPAKFLSTQARRLAMGGESFGENVEMRPKIYLPVISLLQV